LLESRSEAQRAIEQGKVMVRGMPATRAATLVSPDDPIVLAKDASLFVSRGGDKLDGALAHLDVVIEGRRWLDVGASTGGFTDRLLQGGAAAVCAIDVGYGQLDWKLRNDDRVTVMERVNARTLTPEDLPWRADGVVADVSFISLTLVLPAVAAAVEPDADYVLMVKPQFEVGKDAVGPGGVVRDPALWETAIDRVVEGAGRLGLGLLDATASPLPGPAGNREFFIHLRRGASAPGGAVAAAVAEATT
jgi:23S rRNA (cytidine1920-2'-O)/16S rRNA (cytidine1409-2'-O)-methyltransferase